MQKKAMQKSLIVENVLVTQKQAYNCESKCLIEVTFGRVTLSSCLITSKNCKHEHPKH